MQFSTLAEHASPSTQGKSPYRKARTEGKVKILEILRTLPPIAWIVLAALAIRLAVVPFVFDEWMSPYNIAHYEQGNVARALLAGHGYGSPFLSGHTSAKGKPYTAKIVQWIRCRYRIPPPMLQMPEELTVHQVAKHFEVSEHVVYYWIQRSLLKARKLNAGSPYWITLDEADDHKLREWVRNSSRIRTASQTRTEEGAI